MRQIEISSDEATNVRIRGKIEEGKGKEKEVLDIMNGGKKLRKEGGKNNEQRRKETGKGK